MKEEIVLNDQKLLQCLKEMRTDLKHGRVVNGYIHPIDVELGLVLKTKRITKSQAWKLIEQASTNEVEINKEIGSFPVEAREALQSLLEESRYIKSYLEREFDIVFLQGGV